VFVLGDNIFYGHGMQGLLEEVAAREEGASVFGYWVKNPSAYGVAEFDETGKVIGLEEKPDKPRSSYAVAGLYFYDGQVSELASTLKPSARGELEITDLNRLYLEQGKLHLVRLGRGVAWLDTGTHEALLQAANFVQTLQERQGLQIACPEEIAWRKRWIDDGRLAEHARALGKSPYGEYLATLLEVEGPGR
jgi:glucose-1-phosphate thymidylyltransferase